MRKVEEVLTRCDEAQDAESKGFEEDDRDFPRNDAAARSAWPVARKDHRHDPAGSCPSVWRARTRSRRTTLSRDWSTSALPDRAARHPVTNLERNTFRPHHLPALFSDCGSAFLWGSIKNHHPTPAWAGFPPSWGLLPRLPRGWRKTPRHVLLAPRCRPLRLTRNSHLQVLAPRPLVYL